MSTTDNVDLFDDLTASAPTAEPETVESTETPDSADSTENADSEPDAPVETVNAIPEDAVSVTAFALHMTQTLTRKTLLEDGGDLDGSEYVVPQAVYQTVKAQKDRIPHVLVQTPGDKEARVYILQTPATAWWLDRRERLAKRGSGTAAASNRTPEQNLTLLGAAVEKALYAADRLAMWQTRAEQTKNLVEKYKGFLADADVSEDTVALTIQEAIDAHEAEKAAKVSEKVVKAKKDAPADVDTDNA